jgi:hypothetical protein
MLVWLNLEGVTDEQDIPFLSSKRSTCNDAGGMSKQCKRSIDPVLAEAQLLCLKEADYWEGTATRQGSNAS